MSSDSTVAAVIGAASSLVVITGSWIPSLWGDEAASIMSANRDWPSLLGMLGKVDVVHGLYYVALGRWIDLAGASPFAVRLPSGLAVGAASAGLFLLVLRRADRATAIVAACLLTIMPRATYLATEARSGALALAAAVWLTLLALVLIDRPQGRLPRWAVYAVGLAAASTLFLYLLLLIPIHAAAVASHRRSIPPPGIRRFAIAWTAAGALAAPIAVAAATQYGQIAFRERRDTSTVESVLVMPWFMLTPVAVVGWLLIGVAVVAAALHRHDQSWVGRRRLLVLCGAWAIVPAAGLLLVTETITHVYTPRYLAMSAPAVATAMAIGVTATASVGVRVAAVAVVIGLAAPAYVDQRTPCSKNARTDWQTVSTVVDEVSNRGDGIVFDEAVRPSRRIMSDRVAVYERQ